MNNKTNINTAWLDEEYTWEIVYPYQRRRYKQIEDAEFEDIE